MNIFFFFSLLFPSHRLPHPFHLNSFLFLLFNFHPVCVCIHVPMLSLRILDFFYYHRRRHHRFSFHATVTQPAPQSNSTRIKANIYIIYFRFQFFQNCRIILPFFALFTYLLFHHNLYSFVNEK